MWDFGIYFSYAPYMQPACAVFPSVCWRRGKLEMSCRLYVQNMVSVFEITIPSNSILLWNASFRTLAVNFGLNPFCSTVIIQWLNRWKKNPNSYLALEKHDTDKFSLDHSLGLTVREIQNCSQSLLFSLYLFFSLLSVGSVFWFSWVFFCFLFSEKKKGWIMVLGSRKWAV